MYHHHHHHHHRASCYKLLKESAKCLKLGNLKSQSHVNFTIESSDADRRSKTLHLSIPSFYTSRHELFYETAKRLLVGEYMKKMAR